ALSPPFTALDPPRYVRDDLHSLVIGPRPGPDIKPPQVPTLDARARDLHVLPRHRLLLQPCGFERLLLVVVIRELRDLARPERADHGIPARELDAAFLARDDHYEQGVGAAVPQEPTRLMSRS